MARPSPFPKPRVASSKILSRAEASAWAAGLRAAGKRLAFTNGCFDLLHSGHVDYLEAARRQGDALVVGVNTDRSLSASKGPGRPFVPERERAELLAALAAVDAVTLFDEPTPYDVILALRPAVLVKGADWAENAIVGGDLVQAGGGQVVRIELTAGRSTSALIAAVRAGRTMGERD